MFNVTDTYYDSERKIWSGPKKKDFYGPDMTLGEAALFVLSRCPDKVVQVMDTTRDQLTAAQLLQNSQTVARNLLRLGMKPGDVVGFSTNNSINLSSVMLAAFLCGMPTNAVYPDFDKESVAVVFQITLPKIIFCEVENYNTIKAAVVEYNLNAQIYLINGTIKGVHNVKELLSGDQLNTDDQIRFPCLDLTGDDTAVILCSSGTTGIPKGVMCSHKSLLNSQIYPQLRSDNVLFTFSTMYWASGLWTFTAALLNATKLVITDRPFTPEYFIHLIEAHKISHIISGPHHIAQVVQDAQPTLRERLVSICTILCGGSKVPKVVSESMNSILGDDLPRGGLVVAYGMSELSTMLSENDAGPGKRREGTEGKLMPNMQVRIVSSNGELLGVNAAGTVNIRPPHTWRGYYRNPEATEKAIVDGWLVTGDIGYFDDEGYLHICTRDNDVFKSNNFQIYPQQIEEIIMQLPGVLEACVFGVPDFVATNLTACAIVRSDNEAGRNITFKQISHHVEQKMSSIYHLKGGVYFVDALPKTASGKIQRRRVLNSIKKTNT